MSSYRNNPTSAPAANDFGLQSQPAPLQADYQAFLLAPVAAAFAMVGNHESYREFVPNLKNITLCQSKRGLIRVCDFGHGMIVEEQILLWQPPTRFAYAMLTPNPFGIRHHYATVTCQPYKAGTQLRWQHYFEHDDLTAMLSMLNKMFEAFFIRLFGQFEGHMLPLS